MICQNDVTLLIINVSFFFLEYRYLTYRGIKFTNNMVSNAHFTTCKFKINNTIDTQLTNISHTTSTKVFTKLYKIWVSCFIVLVKLKYTFAQNGVGVMDLSLLNCVVWIRTPDSTNTSSLSSGWIELFLVLIKEYRNIFLPLQTWKERSLHWHRKCFVNEYQSI